MDKNQALSVAVGFGGGMGRKGEVCGAVSGAITALGLASNFKEEDGRPKINEVYAKVYRFIDEFTKANGTVQCRDLLGCDLSTEEGQKFFKEQNLKSKCREYVRLCCELLDKYLR
jgi:C_GCAxxG_C_C family probable redox protein